MHVLYFHQHFSTPRGATGTRSYEMAKHLVACGHKVTMVCGSYETAQTGLRRAPRRGLRKGSVDGINVVELCLPYSNYDSFIRRTVTFLKFALRGIRIALNTDYDLLFATSTPLTAGITGIAMKFLKPRKPFVFEVRDLWPELPRAMGAIKNPLIVAGMSLLEWLSYACADGCIGLSPGIRQGIRRRCRPGKRIAMIPNGCDLELFGERGVGRVPSSSIEPARPAVPNAGLRAVFTGAHGIANGLDAVLDAAKVLKDRGRTDIGLTFIGDGKLKPVLVRRAREEHLDNCVFLDPMPKVQLATVLHNLDVGLMILADVPAFYYGTSPNKFFDYIASGLPVLNNYPGWLADLIGEHKCGIVVPPGDPAAFADALIEFADHPEHCREMGANARKLGEQRFDRDKLADEFLGFLETVAESAA